MGEKSTLSELIAWTITLFLAPLMVLGFAIVFVKFILPILIELLKRI